MTKGFKNAVESMEIAFYEMAELADENMPEDDSDPELADWINGQWSTYRDSLESFENAIKTLKEDLR